MIEAVGRIVEATTLPVTADLEAGYGDPAGTDPQGDRRRRRRRQHRGPDAAARRGCRATSRRSWTPPISEGVPDFVLNARTDAFVKGRDRDPADVLADAVERGKAYLDAGRPRCSFPVCSARSRSPRWSTRSARRRLTVIGFPGSMPLERLAELGVARISYGPQPQRVALTALQELVEDDPLGRRRPREHPAAPGLTHAASRAAGRPARPSSRRAGTTSRPSSRRTRSRWPTGLVFTRADGSSYELEDAVATCYAQRAEAGPRRRAAHRAVPRSTRDEPSRRRSWSRSSRGRHRHVSAARWRSGTTTPAVRRDRVRARLRDGENELVRVAWRRPHGKITVREATCDPEPRLSVTHRRQLGQRDRAAAGDASGGGMASTGGDSALAALLQCLGVPAEPVRDPVRAGQLHERAGELLDGVVVGRPARLLREPLVAGARTRPSFAGSPS